MENPPGRRFGRNLHELRKQAGIGQAELAERVSALGKPMRLNSVSRMENGNRTADAEELVALAIALGTTPNRLLLSGTADPDVELELTPNSAVRVPETAAWYWACGESPLPPPDLPEGTPQIDPYGFVDANRPHRPANRTTIAELHQYGQKLNQIKVLAERLRRGTEIDGSDTIPRLVLATYLAEQAFIQEIEDNMEKQEAELGDDE